MPQRPLHHKRQKNSYMFTFKMSKNISSLDSNVQVVRTTYQSEHSSTSTRSKGLIPSRLPAHIQNGCAHQVS